MNKKEFKKQKKIKYKNYFLFFLSIISVINIFLLKNSKCKLSFWYLLISLILQLGLYIVLIFNYRNMLDIYHNIYLIMIIIGSLFLKKIYLLFILFILFISFLTREIFDSCLFSPESKKSMNGTITLFSFLFIIIFRIYWENLYKNLFLF